VGEDEHIAVSDNTYLGVEQGDILTIDRALSPSVGRLVLIVRNGSFKLCRFTEHKGEAYVIWGDTTDASEPFTEESSITVWGVVSALSRRV
jgi:SOS-response transcriptional repressor LexA